ncbi:MAG: hypothetical protein EBR58_14440 [Betaproteobacteria bacterium]|nr:hypothetical protein [Betaproteobacteria bacterium]
MHYDESTPVNDNGQTVNTGVLAIGQVVVVKAKGQGDELQAETIALQHLAVGPVERVDTARNEVRVLGQTLRWSGEPGTLSALKPGQWVRVSGLRMSDGSIDTTRLQPIPPQAQAQLTGPADHGAEGTLRIGETTVQTGRLGFLEGLRAWRAALNGQEVQVQGIWDGKQLVATGMQLQPTRTTMGPVERVVVEGYIKAASTDGLDIGQGRMALGVPNCGKTASSECALQGCVEVMTASPWNGWMCAKVPKSGSAPVAKARAAAAKIQAGRTIPNQAVRAKTKAETTARAGAPRAVAERQKLLREVASKRKALVLVVPEGLAARVDAAKENS